MRKVSGISGAAETAYSKASGLSQLQLQVAAAHAALEDAGLGHQEVDGLINCSTSGVTNDDIVTEFGLRNIRVSATMTLGGAGPVAAIEVATMAIASEKCRHVLVSIARNGSSGPRVAARMGDAPQFRVLRTFEMPLGLTVPVQVMAMLARRHMEMFGTTSAQLGALAVSTREHALLNANAVMRKAISLGDHAASPLVADPLRLLDCAIESDGGCAFVVSRFDTLADLRQTVVQVLATGQAFIDSPSTISQRDDLTRFALADIAAPVFAAAGVRPADMHVAEIYDAFTYMALCQIEDLGFCDKGEGGPFLASGATRLGGTLPINTHGGLLSQAHMLGMNHIVELVRQLRGTAGQAQVANARVGLVTGCGDFGNGSIAVLARL